MGTPVVEFFGALGMQVDKAAWDKANKTVDNFKQKFDGVFQDKSGRWRTANGRFLTVGEKAALGLGQAEEAAKKSDDALAKMERRLRNFAVAAVAGFGFGKLIASGLKYNATVEDTRNQIAGMLALTKKTDVDAQLGVANDLVQNLLTRAKALPGSAQDYAQFMGAITQTITDAGLSLKDLEEITVNGVVGAKAFGIAWDVAARDVNQALMGQFHAVDQFTGRILGSIGYKGEEGRKKFNALSAKQRAEVIKQALTQKQLAQLADLQAKSASGRWATFADNAKMALGRVTAPLLGKLVTLLEQVNTWLDKNGDKVDAFADRVGSALTFILDQLVAVGEYLSDNQGMLGFVLAIAAGIALWMSPLLAAAVAIIGIIALVRELDDAVRSLGGTLDFKQMQRYAELRKQGYTDEQAKAQLASDAQADQARAGAAAASIRPGSSFDEALSQLSQFQPSAASGFFSPTAPTLPGGGSNITNTTTIGDIHVNVPSGVSDPQGVAAALRAELARTYDNRRGGRR